MSILRALPLTILLACTGPGPDKDTDLVDTEVVDTETVDTEVVDTETVDTEVVDTETVDTEVVDTDTGPVTSTVVLADFESPALAGTFEEAAPAGWSTPVLAQAVVGRQVGSTATPSFTPTSGAIAGYITLSPSGSAGCEAVLVSNTTHTVAEAGEQHELLVFYAFRAGINAPSNGFSLSLKDGSTTVATASVPGPFAIPAGNFVPHIVNYTTTAQDVGRTLSFELRTTQPQGSGAFQMLMDDLSWRVTTP